MDWFGYGLRNSFLFFYIVYQVFFFFVFRKLIKHILDGYIIKLGFVLCYTVYFFENPIIYEKLIENL